MKQTETPVEVLPPPTLEHMMNTILSSIIAKHQHAVYGQLMELQKSLEMVTKKEQQNETNQKDNS